MPIFRPWKPWVFRPPFCGSVGKREFTVSYIHWQEARSSAHMLSRVKENGITANTVIRKRALHWPFAFHTDDKIVSKEEWGELDQIYRGHDG